MPENDFESMHVSLVNSSLINSFGTKFEYLESTLVYSVITCPKI